MTKWNANHWIIQTVVVFDALYPSLLICRQTHTQTCPNDKFFNQNTLVNFQNSISLYAFRCDCVLWGISKTTKENFGPIYSMYSMYVDTVLNYNGTISQYSFIYPAIHGEKENQKREKENQKWEGAEQENFFGKYFLWGQLKWFEIANNQIYFPTHANFVQSQ